MNNTSYIYISNHAYMRLKQRNGWSPKTSDRMLPKIYSDGLKGEQVKGYLKQWYNFKSLNESDPTAKYILFGDKLYIFRQNVLITVLPTPSKYSALRKKIYHFNDEIFFI